MMERSTPAIPTRPGTELSSPILHTSMLLLAETIHLPAFWTGEVRLVTTGLQPAPEEAAGQGSAPLGGSCRRFLPVRPASLRIRMQPPDRDMAGPRDEGAQ